MNLHTWRLTWFIWEYGPAGKGTSSSQASFSGSIVIFGGVYDLGLGIVVAFIKITWAFFAHWKTLGNVDAGGMGWFVCWEAAMRTFSKFQASFWGIILEAVGVGVIFELESSFVMGCFLLFCLMLRSALVLGDGGIRIYRYNVYICMILFIPFLYLHIYTIYVCGN